MNAIVGFCHFCEAHGPRPVFCTFTTDNEAHTIEPITNATHCNGCKSLGPETVLITKDDDGTVYSSRESLADADAAQFLRLTAIRSITCEVNWDKEGGVVVFSDLHGLVLSHTFQLHDTRSRGLKRWFSIVVLMKDEQMLLNMSQLLAEHMERISSSLAAAAAAVYEAEQRACPQRALRLSTGSNYFGQGRSLMQLTGNEDIFKVLHSQFARMLKAGALSYTGTQHKSKDLLQKLSPNGQKGLTIFTKGICDTDLECMSIRALESLLGTDVFRTVLYCTLVGINIELRCKATPPQEIIRCLLSLLPKCEPARVAYIAAGAGPPKPGSCVVTESNGFTCEWTGSLPDKCPTLMSRVEGAARAALGDAALRARQMALVLQWLGIASTLRTAGSGARQLRAALGAAPHDDALLQHWGRSFCD